MTGATSLGGFCTIILQKSKNRLLVLGINCTNYHHQRWAPHLQIGTFRGEIKYYQETHGVLLCTDKMTYSG